MEEKLKIKKYRKGLRKTGGILTSLKIILRVN